MSHIYEVASSLHNYAGDFFQNVFAFEVTEAGAATPYEYAKALIDAVDTNMTTEYLALFGLDVILDFYSSKRITGGGGPSSTKIKGLGGPAGTSSISAGIAFDIAWQNASATNRPGHTYIGSVYDGSLIAGQWAPAYVTLIGTWITKMLTNVTLSGGLGTAVFGTFTRKTQTLSPITHGVAKPKPTMLNKRTLPIL